MTVKGEASDLESEERANSNGKGGPDSSPIYLQHDDLLLDGELSTKYFNRQTRNKSHGKGMIKKTGKKATRKNSRLFRERVKSVRYGCAM